MATIHFLNVNEGDCSIIEHDSDRITVIDVCNATIPISVESSRRAYISASVSATLGNFGQKYHPVNPIEYF